MNTERLTVVAPREPQPFWAFAEIVFDSGPIAGVLFYDEYPVDPPEEGSGRETAASIAGDEQHRGWLFWAVGEEVSGAAEDPWRPLVHVLGPQITVAAALRQAVTILEDRDPPTGSYAESADLVAAMLEVDDPEYLLVPASWAIPAGRRA